MAACRGADAIARVRIAARRPAPGHRFRLLRKESSRVRLLRSCDPPCARRHNDFRPRKKRTGRREHGQKRGRSRNEHRGPVARMHAARHRTHRSRHRDSARRQTGVDVRSGRHCGKNNRERVRHPGTRDSAAHHGTARDRLLLARIVNRDADVRRHIRWPRDRADRRGAGASMNQVANLRVISREAELKIVPLDQARAEWDALTGWHPEATLYHSGPWLEVLRRAFGVRPSVAIIGDYSSTRAACLLAQGGNPIRRSLISLPFSDFCPPLAVNDSARESLLSKLAAIRNRPRLEIRGAAGNYPWNVLYHFQRWALDLSRPLNAIEKAAG